MPAFSFPNTFHNFYKSTLPTWYCVSIAMFSVLRGPCFDRESTPYQFPNLTDSIGASSNATSSRKLPLGFLYPRIALFLFKCPSPVWPKHSLPLLRVTGAPIYKNAYLHRYNHQLLLGQEHIHISFFHTPKYLGQCLFCLWVNE